MFSKIFVAIELVLTLLSGNMYTTTNESGNTIKTYPGVEGFTTVEIISEKELEDYNERTGDVFVKASTYLVGSFESIVEYTMERIYS